MGAGKLGLAFVTIAAAQPLLGTTAMAQDVIVYAGYGGTYQDAVREGALKPLAEEMGIEIREETISSIADVKAQVEAGKVVINIPEQNINDCLVGSQQNLWEPLDYSVISTDGIDPSLVKDDWIGGLTYWSTVLAFNTDTFADKQPNSWADFWDVENFPGTRAMYNSPYHNLEIALLADGVEPDQLYPIDIERAINKLNELKPHITVWYTTGAQATQLLTDGEIDMMPFWNGRVSKIIDDGAPVGLTFNQGIMAADCTVIPRGAPNKDLAMKVLARLLEPDMQAAIPQHINYGPINAKAFDTGKISEELAASLPSAPENAKVQVLVNDEWWGDLTNAEQTQEAWNQMVQQ